MTVKQDINYISTIDWHICNCSVQCQLFLEDEYFVRYCIANSSNCITGIEVIMYFELGLKAFIICEDLEEAGNKVSIKGLKFQDKLKLAQYSKSLHLKSTHHLGYPTCFVTKLPPIQKIKDAVKQNTSIVAVKHCIRCKPRR